MEKVGWYIIHLTGILNLYYAPQMKTHLFKPYFNMVCNKTFSMRVIRTVNGLIKQ